MHPVLLAASLLLTLVRGDDLQALSSATSGFSQSLYQKLALNQSSAVYSPFRYSRIITRRPYIHGVAGGGGGFYIGVRGNCVMEFRVIICNQREIASHQLL